MALTIAKVAGHTDHVEGNKRVRVRLVTFDSSYPTGGESLVPADVGMRFRIESVQGAVAPATAGGATARTVAYDHANQKLQVYTTGSAEAADTTDQSAFSIRLRFVGA